MAFIVISYMMVAGCNTSVKGKWSESDKKEFRKDMESIKELSNFGEKKSQMIDCYLRKCESNFSSYNAANQDEKGCEKLVSECVDEILNKE